MGLDGRRLARGALAGGAAAAVWAAQQPLDRRVFDVPYDDTELLGKLVTRGRAWPLVGLTLHVANGAAFGAAFAAVRHRLPGGAITRGALAGMAEHVASWPGTRITDTHHPARDDMPALWGDSRALAQATWRHLLFGVVLGYLEARLNPSDEPFAPIDGTTASTNGHGSIEHIVVTAP